MTHPLDLLADYVHGSLSPDERGAVEAHLGTCQRCTAEVGAAGAARDALLALPVEAAPDALTRAVHAAASEHLTRRGGPGAPAWQRWAGPAAAVAAAALVLTLVLPKIGGGGNSSTDRASAPEAIGAAGAAGLTAAARLERESNDYTHASLGQLASRSAGELAAGTEAASSTIAGAPPEAGDTGNALAATDCIQRAFQQVSGTPVQLIRARFEGAPAYIGLYVEGPGGGQPADALTVRVASVRGCAPLSIAQVPL